METAKDAGWSWVITIALFMTTSLSFGFLQSTGVFFVDWQEDFDASATAVGWTSAISIGGFGISGLVSSIISPYVSCRWQAFFGGVISSTALACSPWIMRIEHLFISMALFGFGVGFVLNNSIVVIGYYFDKKIAIASGLGLCGSSSGMLFMAPLIRYLNDEYSWRGAMLICSGMMGNICVFASLFRLSQAEVMSMAGIRPDATNIMNRNSKCKKESTVDEGNETTSMVINADVSAARRNSLPRMSVVAQAIKRHSTAFVQSYTSILSIRGIMLVVVSNILSGFSYFTALMYLASNAIELGISKTDAAFLVSIYGITGTVGRFLCGPIIDKKIMSPFYFGSLVLGIAGSSCLLGSLARSYAALSIFAAALGLSSSPYNVLYPLLLRRVVGVMMVKKIFGVVLLIWNGCAVIALPLVGYAYDVTGDYRISFYAAGCAFLLNSIVIVLNPVWLELDKRRLARRRSLHNSNDHDFSPL